MTYFKRALSLVLVVLMIMPMLAVQTSAAETYNIIINYVFQNGNEAAQSYTAKVSSGSSFKMSRKSPEVVGYSPDEATVEFDIDSVESDVTETVTYYPTEVGYTVKHYQQNENDDDYTLADTEPKKGLTESTVSGSLAKTYAGFTALPYDDSVAIAADGSTVVEIYYDRNYYLLDLNLDGGYGAEPIYGRYGSSITVATPEKPGYTFNKWTPAIPATMPAENTTHTASWNKGNTTYLVQYWLENANDDNYSYDSSVTKTAKAGDVVSGSNDKSFTGFTYDATKTDENVVVNGDGTTVVNVYYKRNRYTLTFMIYGWVYNGYYYERGWYVDKTFENQVKYGQDTTSYWNQASSEHVWAVEKNGSTYYSHPATMPNGNLTVYGEKKSGTTTLKYYEYGTTTEIKTAFTMAGTYGKLSDEDYIDIPGFSKHSGEKIDGTQEYHLYYTRNKYNLDFKSQGAIVRSYKDNTAILYDAPLKSYNFTPDYPANLEDGAYTFGGWYTDPGCTIAVNWDTMKMPYTNTILYAKWTPVVHKVKTWLTSDMETPVNVKGQTTNIQEVAHRSTAAEVETPVRGNYIFVGWFYMENGVEKAFNFSMGVTKDLDLYAKWSAKTPVAYTINYTLEDGTVIAEPKSGNALAGTTKTFDAKFGDELNEGYKQGYYPLVASHSITMDVEDENTFTFVYVPMEKVKYTVKYLEVGTNNVLATEKNAETTYNVITEKFVTVSGYVPDASNKRLILSADESENVIIFWYTADTQHALVNVTHYIQNIEGDGYSQYSYKEYLGDIGHYYSEDALTIDGFKYNATKSNSSGTLDENGLTLALYYDRIEYPYEFKFVNKFTGDTIADSITGSARYGAQVSANAKDLSGINYVLDSNETQSMIIAIEDPANTAANNVKVFEYLPCFNIVHVQHDSIDDTKESAPEQVTIESEDFVYNITAQVSEGYLYGGTFDVSTCEYGRIHNFDEENPLAFTPEYNATYYIWEIPEHYLAPKLYTVAYHDPDNKGELYVRKVYLLTTSDRADYFQVGFTIDGRDFASDLDDGYDYKDDVEQGNCVLYGTVDVYNSNSNTFREQIYVKNGKIALGKSQNNNGDTGYIGLFKIPASAFEEEGLTYTPYIITRDLVKVTGTTTRTFTHSGYGSSSVGVDDDNHGSVVSLHVLPTPNSIEFVECLSLDYDEVEEAPIVPEMPEEPEVPEIPEEPELPEEPDIPVEDDEDVVEDDTITVTVYDSEVYELVLDAGDISGDIEYCGDGDMLFAGWFTDESYSEPADLTAVYEDIELYAKYVSDSYLQVQVGMTRLFGDVSVMSAVDSADYAEFGFIVNDVTYTVDNCYNSIGFYTPRVLFGRDVARNAKLFSISFPEVDERVVTITPYWVTYDGTTVYGTSEEFNNPTFARHR